MAANLTHYIFERMRNTISGLDDDLLTLERKAIKMEQFIYKLSKGGCCNVCQCKSCDALELLRELGYDK